MGFYNIFRLKTYSHTYVRLQTNKYTNLMTQIFYFCARISVFSPTIFTP